MILGYTDLSEIQQDICTVINHESRLLKLQLQKRVTLLIIKLQALFTAKFVAVNEHDVNNDVISIYWTFLIVQL